MGEGVFSEYQPKYAARGIPTFPCRGDKRPAIRGYMKVGSKGSRELASKFTADAFGFALGKRTGLSVLDVDTPDERILADALAEFGHTPIIVRSGSGNFQAWYKHGGERRQIRPFKGLPIDVLGGGYLIAPPSRTDRGQYGFLQGGLDDLDRLPTMRVEPTVEPTVGSVADESCGVIAVGRRNDELFRQLLHASRQVSTRAELLAVGETINSSRCSPPLPPEEVVKTANSAWKYRAPGLSNDRRRTRDWAVADPETADLIFNTQDAFILLSFLKMANAGRETFEITNEGVSAYLNWTIARVRAARKVLLERGYITLLRQAYRSSPSIYSWSPSLTERPPRGERGSVSRCTKSNTLFSVEEGA